ncbi:hypothetical protein RB195_018577 [Necator americanus]|uniref:Uncharacterized protein n=1 Tax=Necator americanus TaxID=51031 RepID=A0ABR1CCJ6_NECAM
MLWRCCHEWMPVCGVNKGKELQMHLFVFHGYSKEHIAEFKSQKKSRKAAASEKPVHSCIFRETVFNSASGLGRHRTGKLADEHSAPTIVCPLCRENIKNS